MEDDVGCCRVNVNTPQTGPAYGTPEAVGRQGQAFSSMRKIAIVQCGLGVITLISSIGALVVGAMAIKVTYPIVDGMPLLTAILALLSGYFAYKVSICKPETEVKRSTKCYVITHYVFCVTNVSIAFTACTFAGWAIAICSNQNTPQNIGACEPNHELIMTFNIINCISFLLIAISSIWGLVLFCLYARIFGFTNQRDRVNQLERRVANLQSQLDRANNDPPPPYSTGYDNKNYQTVYDEK
ncbi:hypothetical protein LOTGIDRAFT_235055 [Lottia gigantea]|uniref:MARVEL domain-containing protein n=1 Tax=Lottia gigantea TaxID=225164 RepID=V4BFC3_LOTGI|nr:hypothetical protein LOTGIDRAFT_235055 [Lottia gigantea]ESO87604.1 hypothetical protein LOTGIDRAFT_235055 [Lottia gigantea]